MKATVYTFEKNGKTSEMVDGFYGEKGHYLHFGTRHPIQTFDLLKTVSIMLRKIGAYSEKTAIEGAQAVDSDTETITASGVKISLRYL